MSFALMSGRAHHLHHATTPPRSPHVLPHRDPPLPPPRRRRPQRPRRARQRPASPPHPSAPAVSPPTELPPSRPDDAAALNGLAALDSARPLDGDALVALVDETPVAAISVADGRAIADPFRRTADLVALLKLRA